MRILPCRGEIWYADLNTVRGREQAGRRPVLIVSMDTFNHGPADLVAILPLTTRDRGIPLHVPIQPPEGGLKEISYILCDMVRTIARERLLEPWGKISIMTMNSVEDRVRILLGL